RDVPDAGRGLVPRDEPVAPGGEGDAADPAAVPPQAAEFPAGGGVPEEDVPVHARPGEEFAVGRDGDGVHAVLRGPDLPDRLARRGVPHADDRVPSPAGTTGRIRTTPGRGSPPVPRKSSTRWTSGTARRSTTRS